MSDRLESSDRQGWRARVETLEAALRATQLLLKDELDNHSQTKSLLAEKIFEVTRLKAKLETARSDQDKLWTRHADEIWHEIRAGAEFPNPMLALASRVALENLKQQCILGRSRDARGDGQ